MSSSFYLNLPESEQFNDQNFQAFRIILETTIAGKGLQGYLDGTIARPADTFTAQNAVIQILTTPSATAGQSPTASTGTQTAAAPATLAT